MAESAGNLRNAEAAEGEWAAVNLIEADGRIEFAGQLLESVGGAGGRRSNRTVGPPNGSWMTRDIWVRREWHRRWSEDIDESLFKLAVGVNVDRAIFRGN